MFYWTKICTQYEHLKLAQISSNKTKKNIAFESTSSLSSWVDQTIIYPDKCDIITIMFNYQSSVATCQGGVGVDICLMFTVTAITQC